MGLKLTPVPVRCLLGPLGLYEPIADASWAHGYSKQCTHGYCPPAIPTTVFIRIEAQASISYK